MSRPKPVVNMTRTELVAEVRRLRRIERLARIVHDLETTVLGIEKRALLVELWGSRSARCSWRCGARKR